MIPVNLQPSNLRDFLRSRRSVRKFTDAPVADELLREILETATYAPSAHGMQPWRFVVVDSQGTRSALGTALTGQMRADMQAENAPETEIRERVERSLRRMSEAPQIILLCRDAEAQRAQHPAEEQMGMQSVAMAGLQLMLAAHAHGLGTVWICWPLYAGAETRHALNLPASWQPQGMILLGHPAEEPREKKLKPFDEVTIFASLS
ncbi:MAG: nitroreductase [Chloroflexi bacterium HGW-Chloroflexi-6]|nr:MAG: nitroreductase [Chloroflexi bacterium HGW-Chloroflexi-6]